MIKMIITGGFCCFSLSTRSLFPQQVIQTPILAHLLFWSWSWLNSKFKQDVWVWCKLSSRVKISKISLNLKADRAGLPFSTVLFTCTWFIRRSCHEEEETVCENQPSCNCKDCSLWHPGHCKVQVPAYGLQMPVVNNKIRIHVILILPEFY